MESLTISFDTQQVVLWQSQAAEFKACPCYTLNIDKTLAFFIYVNYGFCCSWKSLYYIDQGGKHTHARIKHRCDSAMPLSAVLMSLQEWQN